MKSYSIAALLICGAFASQPPVEPAHGQFAPIGSKPPGDPATKAPVEHPDFEPYPDPEDFASASLFEQFSAPEDEIWKKWKVSHAKKQDSEDEFSYVGKWAIEEPYLIPGFKGDKGLVLKTTAAHHAISNTFDKPLIVDDKPLVVQYEVKLQQGLVCGGAYVKLLGEQDGEFSNATPYVVMFGPDKCGPTDKVHLIIQRKTSGEWVEHHLSLPTRTEPGKLSALYTLIINPDQTYEVRVNSLVRKAGSLLDEAAFVPPFTAPKEIYDENDEKPDDWVDEEEIPDPKAKKPADWDETLPFKIPDPDAVKPEDWLDDEEPFIPDSAEHKPSDWDDEEDGEWIAPEVPNPKCQTVSGCGEWKAPLIKNPDYKGIWSAPLIPNPDYKGEWEPRKIANPNYYEDKTPAKLDPITGVGLELWTMQSDILFDNFYIGQSVYEAELLGNATWGPKYYTEQQEMQNTLPDDNVKGKYSYLNHFKKDPVRFLQLTFSDVWGQWRVAPMQTLQDQPIGFAIVASLLLVGSTILFGLINVLLFVFSGKQLPNANKTTKKAKGTDAQQLAKEAEAVAKTSESKTTAAKKRKV